mmetsp:Transcript_42380/g.133725  ORF Transcript_42380/g.133725 Transcript_42380/m.133725 type:complete len:224 (-) Transcript_42380:748-1419(-)
MPSRSEFALVAVSVYALALTLRHAQLSAPLNSLCTRDFVEPAASGTCLCGDKEFCLCTPSLAADVIIELEDSVGTVRHVVFIERKDGRGLAMVGGFVKVGESAEAAAAREAAEETGLEVTQLQQWCMFSEPRRDPRRHTAALVFVGRARGTPRSGDDAKGIRVVSISDLQRAPPKFAFDHGQIVAAFVARNHPLEAHAGWRRRNHRSSGGGSAADAYDGSCRV